MGNPILLRFLLIVILVVVSGSYSPVNAACGKVTIADMNWPSASFMAHLDRLILEHGYDCKVELVTGDTVPTGASMIEKGEPDIAPELWTNSFAEQLNRGIAEKRLRIAGNSLSEGGEEGFWVPKYMVEKEPSLSTIKGVIKHAKLFTHPEKSEKSAFYGCPAGWVCQITSGHLFRALKLADHNFELIDPGSAAGLDGSLIRAFERKLPWFGYYWAPTPILGRYDMVKVDFQSGIDEKHWKSCITQAECPNPKVSMFPSSPVVTVTTENFARQASEAYLYLAKRSFKNDQMNKILGWIDENQADGETAAIHFLKNHQSIWMPWVPVNIATKIKQVLKNI